MVEIVVSVPCIRMNKPGRRVKTIRAASRDMRSRAFGVADAAAIAVVALGTTPSTELPGLLIRKLIA